MTPHFSPARERAIRQMLIDQVSAATGRHARRTWAVAFIGIGLVSGLGVSAAAYAVTSSISTPRTPSGQPTAPDGPAVTAPTGVIPGAPVVSIVGSPQVVDLVSATKIDLTGAPAGATHIRTSITVDTPGQLSWGTDSGGNNPSASWSDNDFLNGTASTSYDFPLDDTTKTLGIWPSGGLKGTMTVQFVNYIPTHLGINEAGQTYGVEGGPDGRPDLLYVSGRDPGGARVNGYAETSKLEEGGGPIPVYKSDGRTQVGVFDTAPRVDEPVG